jgi:hypothetical protein
MLSAELARKGPTIRRDPLSSFAAPAKNRLKAGRRELEAIDLENGSSLDCRFHSRKVDYLRECKPLAPKDWGCDGNG